jgi:AcrR family transcriptional regulator
MPIEARREQVLDAALRLIIDRGYDAVTMEAIARESDLSKPVVYNAYPGLGPLLLALLEREEARGLKALADAMPPRPVDADASGILLFWLRSLADAIAMKPDPWRLILIPPEETPELVREHVQAGRTFALNQLRSLISAQDDVELATQTLLAIAEHFAKLLIREPDEYQPNRLVAFAESVLQALEL